MAEAKQVEAGLVGPTPADDPVEAAGVATLRSSVAPDSMPGGASGYGPRTGDAPAGADSEPSASVRGVPTWTFALPRCRPSPGARGDRVAGRRPGHGGLPAPAACPPGAGRRRGAEPDRRSSC